MEKERRRLEDKKVKDQEKVSVDKLNDRLKSS